ncbi:hypothetical protein L6164_034437 [Bauhinia variegata]|uniref:Uncharacterized protein n=1 Tax=Bauhinia variegata TaxID=167791 RepID=A0ACB9KV86_BAUVA|nr:hypothetical protein L6164_034437 [Bauhinia variegata]
MGRDRLLLPTVGPPLKRRAGLRRKQAGRGILTWEDAYYDNPDDYDSSSSENKCCPKTTEQSHGGHFSQDPLGLAVANMSYHVYSLGEGIVGQVAVTGKHRWICADKQVTGSGSSFEFTDGWQSQFSAGIRTIVVVAVVPLGVVQLGSLNNVVEDMGVVTHIRNLFLETQDFSIGHFPSQIQNSAKNSPSPPDASTKNLLSEIVPDCLHDIERTRKSETLDSFPFKCSGKNFSPTAVYQNMAVDAAKHGGPELYSDESSILLQSITNTMNLEHKKIIEMRPVNEMKCGGDSSGCEDMRVETGKKVTSLAHTSVMDNSSFNDFILPSENVGVDSASFPSGFLDAIVCESDKLRYSDINQKGVLNLPKPLDATSHKDTGKSGCQTETCYRDTSYTLLNFPAGCELHEALGPDFLKRSRYFDWEAQVNQDTKPVVMPDEISCSQLTSESHLEHLLEAIVANVCHSNNDVNSELSFCTSVRSAMAPERKPEASIHTVHSINSEGFSMDHPSLVREDKQRCLSSSGICSVMSPKGFSSTCPSSCSEQFERSSEPAKNNKKRARPGESCRPRPRDRQLIQDRIKELRELVPNGAKCSIDSLLERTIKHMLFLQSVTKHADKLNKFTDSKTKLHHMEVDVHGSSSYEQGSSWAMEVGGHLKVRSILVENLSKNGQMLVEMLCEECSHFLEIAEAIRSLGLTILKGATEAQGENTWICFVVEGQNNRTVHRLDILWPLVQILQSKSTMYSQ